MVICFVSVGAEDGEGDIYNIVNIFVNQRYHPPHPRLKFTATKLFDPEDISSLMVPDFTVLILNPSNTHICSLKNTYLHILSHSDVTTVALKMSHSVLS